MGKESFLRFLFSWRWKNWFTRRLARQIQLMVCRALVALKLRRSQGGVTFIDRSRQRSRSIMSMTFSVTGDVPRRGRRCEAKDFLLICSSDAFSHPSDDRAWASSVVNSSHRLALSRLAKQPVVRVVFLTMEVNSRKHCCLVDSIPSQRLFHHGPRDLGA